MVPEVYVGVPFRQLAGSLKIYKVGRPSERRVSQRPADYTGGPFTDSEEKPTLITFEADDAVDVDALLATGAIMPHTKRAQRAAEAGGATVLHVTPPERFPDPSLGPESPGG
jgi:hypothetical protein